MLPASSCTPPLASPKVTKPLRMESPLNELFSKKNCITTAVDWEHLSNWCAQYLVATLVGIDVCDQTFLVETTNVNYAWIVATTQELVNHQHQTAFALVHLLRYVNVVAAEGYGIPEDELLESEISEVVTDTCTLLKQLYILAHDALEDEVEDYDNEDRMALQTKLDLTGFDNVEDYTDALDAVVQGIFRGQRPTKMSDKDWRLYSAHLKEYVSPQASSPLIVRAFPEMSDVESRLGYVRFIDLPCDWLEMYKPVDGAGLLDEWESGKWMMSTAPERIIQPRPQYKINIVLLERQSLTW
ncbi:hypothetical protein CYLTODRAFT_466062 [Cylindrobasidium torrendii FP15055 ss-10]|uniref:Uncharacterized protein n=1 Tax=Cylindrobasidium torrendii FP15055 ss-10 TaxID=1314674 RepID=A0A0D7B3X2_9AGAR|nr:hypothetical protein CYLTODRAFT_466062 [Cylindrobasidium torrendii FP15055 ss-10]